MDPRTPAAVDGPPPKGPLAPETCITVEPCVGVNCVTLVATDLKGIVRAKLEVGQGDAQWWCKVLRYFLAWRYGSAYIRLIEHG